MPVVDSLFPLFRPDAGVFRLALHIAPVPPRHAVYIGNTPMFIEVAEGFEASFTRITILPTRKLASFGLQND